MLSTFNIFLNYLRIKLIFRSVNTLKKIRQFQEKYFLRGSYVLTLLYKTFRWQLRLSRILSKFSRQTQLVSKLWQVKPQELLQTVLFNTPLSVEYPDKVGLFLAICEFCWILELNSLMKYGVWRSRRFLLLLAGWFYWESPGKFSIRYLANTIWEGDAA